MSSWRDEILKEFTPQLSNLTLAKDPDGLLLEEGVQQGIAERGHELLTYDDPVAFRFAYESKYRSRWDSGEVTDKAVVIRCEGAELRSLPSDLMNAGRVLSFGLADLFPNLSYAVVSALSRSDMDLLYRAQSELSPPKLGDNLTKDFILRYVFEFAPELINDVVDFLRLVLRRHYLKQRIPSILEERLVQMLVEKKWLEEWPVKAMVCDREFFLSLLQERWPLYLDKIAKDAVTTTSQAEATYSLRFPGPPEFPFDEEDLRVYIDTLFMDGWLKPVDHPAGAALSRGWVAIGIRREPGEDTRRRLERLLTDLSGSLPGPGAPHETWLTFAERWAHAIVLRYKLQTPKSELISQFSELQRNVDDAFLDWVQKRFGGLHNQPPPPPAMVHHIARTLAQNRQTEGKNKLALVVIDGLSLDQWIVLRDELMEQRPDMYPREGSVFAWIPTITSVSRQSIFAGNAPFYFPSTIFGTDREPALWTRFWVEQGLDVGQIDYARGIGNAGSLEIVDQKASHPKTAVMGLVVDQVDKIMHGMTLGTAGMHNQVRQWAKEGFLTRLVDLLHQYEFQVFLTSDHGNIEGSGCGRPTEGSAAEVRGERVRIYPAETLRSHVKSVFPESLEWPPVGLPPGFLPLVAPRRSAFVPVGERAVVHGGISVEELIVPFIRLERRVHET